MGWLREWAGLVAGRAVDPAIAVYSPVGKGSLLGTGAGELKDVYTGDSQAGVPTENSGTWYHSETKGQTGGGLPKTPGLAFHMSHPLYQLDLLVSLLHSCGIEIINLYL